MSKKRPLPFDCVVLEHPEEITNKFSGEKIMLEPDAVAVYDSIKGAEYLADPNNGDDPKWEIVRKGFAWFQKPRRKNLQVTGCLQIAGRHSTGNG